jgi:hypothetical protein
LKKESDPELDPHKNVTDPLHGKKGKIVVFWPALELMVGLLSPNSSKSSLTIAANRSENKEKVKSRKKKKKRSD